MLTDLSTLAGLLSSYIIDFMRYIQMSETLSNIYTCLSQGPIFRFITN